MAISTSSQAEDLLVFVLGSLRFGIALTHVREVARAVFITPLPDAPIVIEGIIDVRGSIVPVYDLRMRFNLPARSLNIADRIVVAWAGNRLVAVRCEQADTVRGLTESSVEPGEQLRHAGRLVAGVARHDDGLILIHDLEQFLDDAEAVSLDAALAAIDDGGA